MFGAIIGDIVGSAYEFCNIKTKDFPLFSPACDYTDDSLMTIAVGQALSTPWEDMEALKKNFVQTMQAMGQAYPYPTGSYGGRFSAWLRSRNPQPYGSFGNGSAMRVSPCGLYAATLEEALDLAKASAEVTHNHPEGIKGAQATAAAIFLARTGSGKDSIRDYIREHFYPLEETLEQIRPAYRFDESCQGTVPQAIQAFLESDSFEDAIRNAVSLGGDSDTLGAITGSMAWSYYCAQNGGSPTDDMLAIWDTAAGYLPSDLAAFAEEFRIYCNRNKN